MPTFDDELAALHRMRHPKNVVVQCPIDASPVVFLYPSTQDLDAAAVQFVRECECMIPRIWWAEVTAIVVGHWTQN